MPEWLDMGRLGDPILELVAGGHDSSTKMSAGDIPSSPGGWGSTFLLLDAVSIPLLLSLPGLRIRFENRAFRGLLERTESAEEVRTAVQMLLRSSGGGEFLSPSLTVDHTAYRATVRILGSGTASSGAPRLVTLVPCEPGPPTLQELRRRFDLTPREAEVALLLVGGHSNKAVAGALGISVRTSQNHTRQVLEKLEVRSRSEVPSRVLLPSGWEEKFSTPA